MFTFPILMTFPVCDESHFADLYFCMQIGTYSSNEDQERSSLSVVGLLNRWPMAFMKDFQKNIVNEKKNINMTLNIIYLRVIVCCIKIVF